MFGHSIFLRDRLESETLEIDCQEWDPETEVSCISPIRSHELYVRASRLDNTLRDRLLSAFSAEEVIAIMDKDLTALPSV